MLTAMPANITSIPPAIATYVGAPVLTVITSIALSLLSLPSFSSNPASLLLPIISAVFSLLPMLFPPFAQSNATLYYTVSPGLISLVSSVAVLPDMFQFGL